MRRRQALPEVERHLLDDDGDALARRARESRSRPRAVRDGGSGADTRTIAERVAKRRHGRPRSSASSPPTRCRSRTTSGREARILPVLPLALVGEHEGAGGPLDPFRERGVAPEVLGLPPEHEDRIAPVRLAEVRERLAVETRADGGARRRVSRSSGCRSPGRRPRLPRPPPAANRPARASSAGTASRLRRTRTTIVPTAPRPIGIATNGTRPACSGANRRDAGASATAARKRRIAANATQPRTARSRPRRPPSAARRSASTASAATRTAAKGYATSRYLPCLACGDRQEDEASPRRPSPRTRAPAAREADPRARGRRAPRARAPSTGRSRSTCSRDRTTTAGCGRTPGRSGSSSGSRRGRTRTRARRRGRRRNTRGRRERRRRRCFE